MSGERVQDRKPYIAKKSVIVAKSGIYRYTKAEILARGLHPVEDKEIYLEYRPASVIRKAVFEDDLFSLMPVPPGEHIEDEINSDNFPLLGSAMIAGPFSEVSLGNEFGFKGQIAFFTQPSFNYYEAGNKETSADYNSISEVVDNPKEVGYDILLKEIVSVNNVAITARGRGGHDVRILDKAPNNAIDAILGRKRMGILSGLIGKPKVKFSTILEPALKQARTTDSADKIPELIGGVMTHINGFKDSTEKAYIVGAVRDSFMNAEKVLEPDTWKESARILDALFTRCQDSEEADAKKVVDSLDKEKDESKNDDEDAEKKKKETADKESGKVKDTAVLIDEAFAKIEGKMQTLIDAGIKKALNLGDDGAGKGARAKDSLDAEIDASFVMEGSFGNQGDRY